MAVDGVKREMHCTYNLLSYLSFSPSSFTPETLPKVDPNPMMLGVSQMATRMQDGAWVEYVDVNFPYALVFKPDPKLKDVHCDFGNVTSQLQVEYGGEKVIIQ